MKLCFPERILEQHLVVLGKTGAGKSSALRHIVEHLLDHKKRVCIIDIKGDWWGLKSSTDGRGPGYPVVAFGNFREPKAADIPINPQSGRDVATLITGGNRPCIIGLCGWMPGQITDFWLEFAPSLFNTNQGELFVVVSECHNFAPKGKILDPKAGKVIHWTNRLLSEGRGIGLTFLLDSQRPQKVHNDTLTCCETLVAMRVNHAADRGAIKDWIDGCGDKAQGVEVLNNLAQLSRGEAYVWSPEIGFGPQRLKFPMFETFDSFAPPQLQHKINQSGWQAVDLDAVKAKLATVIEEAKQNDPAELKKRIRELEKHFKAGAPVIDESAIQRALAQRDREHERSTSTLALAIAKLKDTLSGIAKQAASAAEIELPEASAPAPYRAPVPPARIERPHKPASNGNGDKLPRAERMILSVLAQYPEGRTKIQVAVIAGYAVDGGGFGNAISSLRSSGFIGGTDVLRITQAGVDALGHYDPLPTGEALLAYWKGKLPKAERCILDVVASSYPTPLCKEDIAAAAGYEPNGGGFGNALSRLRTLELISGRAEITASENLFG